MRKDLHDGGEDNNLIAPKDIYRTIWHCRDFELKYYWQRALFLATFLLACYPGYGVLWFHILECKSDKAFVVLNLFALIVALLGIILSVLYVMMGKGSKYWYESYEKALFWIERDPRYSEWEVAIDMDKNMYVHGNSPSLDDDKSNPSLMSLKAWRYSLSKINIAIGRVSIILWIVVYSLHTIYFSVSCRLYNFFNATFRVNSQGGIIVVSLIIWLFLGLAASCFCGGVDSSSPEEREAVKKKHD